LSQTYSKKGLDISTTDSVGLPPRDKTLRMSSPPRKPVLLLILDGWGLAGTGDPARPDLVSSLANSAIELARTPVWHKLWRDWPHVELLPHGSAVGLTDGQMGNSEVGHLNLGAGRVVWQDLLAATKLIESGGLATHPAWQGWLGDWRKAGDELHFIGLFSDGGVHSHIKQLRGLAQSAAQSNPGARIWIHALLDGRDTAPRIAEQYFESAREWLPPSASFATLGGRYFGMDRDKRWERVKLAWEAIVQGRGQRCSDWRSAMALAREHDEGDEFATPTVLGDYAGMRGASARVCCFNFRADRARQLSEAFMLPGFEGFERGTYPRISMFTLKRYRDDLQCPVLLEDHPVDETLAQVVSRHASIRGGQARIYKSAETEKYAHVTYFFNGGREEPWPGEERALVPSPQVATYDLKPEMSVNEVTDKLRAALESGAHDLYVVNFANGDMVGHTGVREACIAACEAVDACLGRVLDACGWGSRVSAIITADHGNCDVLSWPDGTPHTQHSMNNSPLVLVSEPRRGLRAAQREGAPPWSLRDVAPTILDLLGIAQPECWDGESLLLG
jgi:2,3-bisphosphoglycerate-independent phosphoglycerate mutase